eukprot:scaffold10274_cov106-Isochrysis_galbana.AAC.3
MRALAGVPRRAAAPDGGAKQAWDPGEVWLVHRRVAAREGEIESSVGMMRKPSSPGGARARGAHGVHRSKESGGGAGCDTRVVDARSRPGH